MRYFLSRLRAREDAMQIGSSAWCMAGNGYFPAKPIV